MADSWASYLLSWLPATKEVETVIIREVENMKPQEGKLFLRIAGLSGALAVVMGAYGAHAFRNKEDVDSNLKYTFEVGNKYHFFHSIALLGAPLCRKPNLVGGLMCSGMLLFSGSCYVHALTQNAEVRQVTPYGGILLIAAWLSMVL